MEAETTSFMSVFETPGPSMQSKQCDDHDMRLLLPPIAVKSEPSSPTPPIGRRLATSGVKRFSPLPGNCQPSCPQYKHNRKQWVVSCVKELRALGLKVERTMIRDDGLVIDWSSPIPVWADTLEPNTPSTCDLASVIVQTYETNVRTRHHTGKHSSSGSRSLRPPSVTHSPVNISPSKRERDGTCSSSIHRLLPSASIPTSTESSVDNSSTGRKLPVPPRLSSVHRAFSPQTNGQLSSLPTKSTSTHISSQRPRSPTHGEDFNSIPSKRKRSPAPSVSSPSTTDPGPSTVLDGAQTGRNHYVLQELQQSVMPAEYASPADRELTEMSLDYIRRYIQTYEADRASLASAYSRLATFACRKHKQTFHSAQMLASTSWASTGDISECSALKRGRLDVITELVTLPSLHCAIPNSEPMTVHTSAGKMRHVAYDMLYLGPQLGVFVVCQIATLTGTVVHAFMLQRREVDKEEADVVGVWPVVANVHQVVVFES
ncbi:hypothetical protein EDD16DRAFT_1062840 [Pisolithus croceorrhizus]|nr:hypothetical protein EDD16DRAFT_1062840 [Pisolithus croceorrhizus]KAI6148964.1 hypothetical protein EDD17DRAFT_1225880 [Pisolithus thermaeus]